MKSLIHRGCVVGAVFAACAAMCTVAGATSMTLTSGGNDILNGVYIGPYSATISGVNGGNPVLVICDDFVDDTFVGETWSASKSTVASLSGQKWNPANTQQAYNEAAYLSGKLMDAYNSNNTLLMDEYQVAIWYLFDPIDVTNWLGASNSILTGAEGFLNTAANQTYTPGEFGNVDVYTPAGGGPPQEFLYVDGPPSTTTVATPEPSDAAVLAADLFGFAVLAGVFRKRLFGAPPKG